MLGVECAGAVRADAAAPAVPVTRLRLSAWAFAARTAQNVRSERAIAACSRRTRLRYELRNAAAP